jgi:hypothetical protein
MTMSAPRSVTLDVGRGDADHEHALGAQHLHQKKAHPTRGGVHECHLARLGGRAIGHQVLRGQALQQDGRGRFGRNVVRQRNQLIHVDGN